MNSLSHSAQRQQFYFMEIGFHRRKNNEPFALLLSAGQ